MKILHISTECYPAAKAGGMGDVVGALPIYQQRLGVQADVIIPKYGLPWFVDKDWEEVLASDLLMEGHSYLYSIQRLAGSTLPFVLYVVDIPSLYDRPSVYLDEDGEGFVDEPERNIAFQRAVCDFASDVAEPYDILHCHDHQAGLVPFFAHHLPEYASIRDTPTFFTIHNGEYRGIFDWDRVGLLPPFAPALGGLLEWGNTIHSQASAIKCAWRVGTVSPSYMEELRNMDEQIQWLYQNEASKCFGILNGADYEVWDPKTDPMLPVNLKRSWRVFKEKNQEYFKEAYQLNGQGPLFSFIGRLAYQKGADLLPEAIGRLLESGTAANFAILGTGDKWLERSLEALGEKYPGQVAAIITYDEALAHRIYAASDFLLMPSRFEPCGLNQMFAMRYACVPVVRRTGGLIDTVPDISNGGNGIVFQRSTATDVHHAMQRCLELYERKEDFSALQTQIAALDFSWEHSASVYLGHYRALLNSL